MRRDGLEGGDGGGEKGWRVEKWGERRRGATRQQHRPPSQQRPLQRRGHMQGGESSIFVVNV